MATKDAKGKGSGRSASATGSAQGSPATGEARRRDERVPKDDAPQHLILEDLYDVYGELYEVRTQWRPLGGILRVGPANLDAVGAQYRDIPDDCLRETLSHWLKQVNPLPTWKVIVDALRNPMMEQAALAQNLEGRHCPDGGGGSGARVAVAENTPLHRELVNELKTVSAQWDSIGLQLGLVSNDLQMIRRDKHYDTTQCFTAMLDKWLRSRTRTSDNQAWITICEVLGKLDEKNFACKVAEKHGISPRIKEQPQHQNAKLRDSITFRCIASTSGQKIEHMWMHNKKKVSDVNKAKYSCVVKDDVNKVESQPADLIIELEIKDVIEDDIGKYSCVVKNYLGEVNSKTAELKIGVVFDRDNLRKIVKEANIEYTDWPRIGECLGQDLRNAFVEGILAGIQLPECSVDKANLWNKVAQTLEGMEGCRQAANKAKNNAGVEITRDKLRAVFMDAGTADWHRVVQDFPNFNESCLIEVLMEWHSKQKCQDPWMSWRKLAALVESSKEDINDLEGDKEQLGIGYQLRLWSGVGLGLNPDNFYTVLTEAGIKDWSIIVSLLKVDPKWVRKIGNALKSLFWKADPVHKQILSKWQEPRSWEELARVIEESNVFQEGPNLSQKIRGLSGSGGFPKIRYLYTPGLNERNVIPGTLVTLTCEARGAPPLKYNWKCDGHDCRLPNSRTVQIKVPRGGKYSCHVENGFDSDTSGKSIEFVCGIAPLCKFDQTKINLPIGDDLSLHCEKIQGTEPCQYTWLHDGDKLPPDGPNLIIEKVTLRDAGNYECRVSNKFKEHTASVKVKVGEPPVIKSISLVGPKRIHYERGETLTFYCDASGTDLQYAWQCTSMSVVKKLGKKKREVVTTTEEAEGEYRCQVKNDFGQVLSDPIEVEVGIRPAVKALPEIVGSIVLGERVQLTCEVEGKGGIQYVWMHDNQTLVKGAGPCRQKKAELIIEQMTEADQGEYVCRFTNAFGFAVSEPVTLRLELTLNELMEQLCPVSSSPISHRWYMLGILLEVEKSILNTISRAFAASGNFKYALQEVIGSWLERKYKPKKFRTSGMAKLRDAVCRMGYEKLARDLGTKPEIEGPIKVEVEGTIALGKKITLTCKATGKPPLRFTWLHNDAQTHEINNSKFTIESMVDSDEGEYKCNVSNEVGSVISEVVTLKAGSTVEDKATEYAEYDAKDMSREFEDLAGKVKEILTDSDSPGSDTAISGIQAYLDLIKFKKEDIERVKDLQSVIEFLRKYWNYQRYHLLEKLVNQFSSKQAQAEMQKFIDKFGIYQATTTLGEFIPLTQGEGSPDCENLVHATVEGDPSTTKNPPFMKSFKIKLESKWATCTLRDADNLLVNLLPDTVSHEVVWSSAAYRTKENSVWLEYLVSPTVVELLNKVMEIRRKNMRSMGVLCVQVDDHDFKPETQSIITRFQLEEEEANPHDHIFQLLMNQLKELKDDVKYEGIIWTKHASMIEELQRDLQDTRSKQASAIKALQNKQSSEIEALQRHLEETRSKQGSQTETLQQDLQETKSKQGSEIETLQKAHEETRTTHGREIKALERNVEETKRKQGSDIEALQQDFDKTKSKQASEIEALQQDLKETKKTHGSKIEDLQRDLQNTEKSFTVNLRTEKQLLHEKVDRNKRRASEEIKKQVTAEAAAMKESIDPKIRHELMKYAPTKSLSVSNPKVAGSSTTTTTIPEGAAGTIMKSKKQGHHQELVDATVIVKTLEEIREEIRKDIAQMRTELFEELKRKNEELEST